MADIRMAKIEDLESIYEIERLCFPPAEAAGKDTLRQRLERFSSHFFLLEENGEPVGLINGMVTDSPVITDPMFENCALHQEHGRWQTVFGLDVLPGYRRKGYGALLMNHFAAHAKAQGRRGCCLTCKEGLIPYYEKLGYQLLGVSQSVHGGAVWYDMQLIFLPEGRTACVEP